MIRSPIVLFALGMMLFMAAEPAHADNFCNDCYQLQIQRRRPNGSFYFESDGACCPSNCFTYEAYTLKDVDVGWGCSTKMGDGILVVGDICASSNVDLGCPDPLLPLPPVIPKPRQDQPPPNPDGGPESPILLDLGDEGYRLTSVSGGVQFDLRNEGRRVQTAWTRLGVENAFLALDRNGNGHVDNGAELFGNFTPLLTGGVAPNGFVALEEYDANQDGAVDSADPVWRRLVLWTDRNHDGMSTNDELQPIADSIVESLETDHRLTRKKDQWGNEFRYLSHFQFRRGLREKNRAYYDVFFRTGE